ncbi:MAG: acetylxylan esterase [Clostridia bacterium]|nr:acetylxylan esterase [Clostridia bacterium]
MAKYFKCFTDKNPVSYKLGEEIVFTVFAREDGENIKCEKVGWELSGDDGDRIKGFADITEDKPLIVKYTLKRAGFVHLNCVALDGNDNKIEDFEPLDASAGVDVTQITYSDTVPEDFDEYWDEIEKTVANFETEVVYLKESNKREGYKTYEVWIKTPSGRPASGHVTIPLKEGKFPIRISFLGYGLHAAGYEYDENMICGCFNAHGFENEPWDQIEPKYGKELNMYGFNNEENASNMTTYFRNMMIRNLIALKYLKTLPEWNNNDILAVGGSQGALQAITVAVHDKDVTEAITYKPWLCDLNAENNGYLSGWRPDFAEGLRYFDTVAQGTRLKCPISIECYLGDYCCPPKTVMALYNSVKSDKKIKFVQSARHSYFPPEDESVEPIF